MKKRTKSKFKGFRVSSYDFVVVLCWSIFFIFHYLIIEIEWLFSLAKYVSFIFSFFRRDQITSNKTIVST